MYFDHLLKINWQFFVGGWGEKKAHLQWCIRMHLLMLRKAQKQIQLKNVS